MSQDPSALAELRRSTKQHVLWQHAFLSRCSSGQVSLAEVRALAGQMYRFSKEFGRMLAQIFVACPDEQARVVLAENLYEELGEGDAARTHAELFRRFTRALGVSDAKLEAMRVEPETQALIDTYLSLPSRHGWLAALGAVCFASEGIVSTLYSQLQTGIAGAAALPADSMVFFELHVVTDTGHAASLAKVIEPYLGDPAVHAHILDAVREAMDARVKFFDGVMRRSKSRSMSYSAFLLTQDLPHIEPAVSAA